MRILAIDSSSMVATVAVVTDGVLTAEYTINHKKTHSQTLLPMIDEIKKNIDLDMNTVDAIAIASTVFISKSIFFFISSIIGNKVCECVFL